MASAPSPGAASASSATGPGTPSSPARTAAYYNEIEPFAVEWLHNLQRAGHLTDGLVDCRSIVEVAASDLAGYERAHFFAGIGGWDYALKLAGWSGPVWTGSCPCQPFSVAGPGLGFDDPRHLWPKWFALIEQCRPPVVFGEQVASPDGKQWLDLVSADLEGAGYAVGAANLCAGGVGAPHIRQRLYFVAVANGFTGGQRSANEERRADRSQAREESRPGGGGASGIVAIASEQRREGLGVHLRERGPRAPESEAARRGASGVLEHANAERAGRQRRELSGAQGSGASGGEEVGRELDSAQHAGATGGAWRDADWLPCDDGKARPVEPGTFPLAHGIPNRVGRVRAYGNAIVPQVAATFIRAVMESM